MTRSSSDEPAALAPTPSDASSTRSSRRSSIWAGRSPRSSISTSCSQQIPRLIGAADLVRRVRGLPARRAPRELRVAYSVGYPQRETRSPEARRGARRRRRREQQPLLVNDVVGSALRRVRARHGLGDRRAAAAQVAADRRAQHPQPHRDQFTRATSRSCGSSPRTSRSRSSTRGCSSRAASTPKRSRRSPRSAARSRPSSISTSCSRASRSSPSA